MINYKQSTLFNNLKKKYKIKSLPSKSGSFLSKPLVNQQLIKNFLIYYQRVEKHKWHNQSWYYGTGLHYSESCDILPITKQVCGGAFNNPYYQNTLLFDKPVCPELTDNLEFFPLVRCKITTIENDATNKPINQKDLWHRDETPFEVLRVIIPLTTDESYQFQMDNNESINLKVGMVYAFDQSIYHRVFKKHITSHVNRTHLILSYVTWFNKFNGEWIPNDYTGKIHPLDIFEKQINL